MDPEMRKAYNSLYYKRNKDKILQKLTAKVQCEFCNRTVSACNIQKHFTLPICQRTQEKNKYISTRQNI
jgi:hypothetical protein